ncbi:MAG TPA: hypothetical protein VG944_19005 [Fimbriimonas sp.]|nr:hypothetical protein [Fimbriimonas sp.]
MDFVLGFWASLGSSKQCILDLGFQAKGSPFIHTQSPFTLDLPLGPFKIGDSDVSMNDCAILTKEDMTLKILSPTDCVRDRLSWFLLYHTNPDFSALDQAVAVANRHKIDLEKTREWAKAEGEIERLAYFEQRLKAIS